MLYVCMQACSGKLQCGLYLCNAQPCKVIVVGGVEGVV